MTYKICYWDDDLKQQLERDATEDETAEFDARKAAALIPQVPQQVDMKQARLALLQSGFLSTVETILASMEGIEGQAARIEWEFSQYVHRNHSLVLVLGTALNLTETQLDDLFILAVTL